MYTIMNVPDEVRAREHRHGIPKSDLYYEVSKRSNPTGHRVQLF